MSFLKLVVHNSRDHSLVAISGLGSHAWGSFKKRKESSMWLADKLPGNWPRARIMLYGYRSSIRDTGSRQTLLDVSKTFHNALINMRKSPNRSRHIPLVLLAHSLGGLVVKQALVNLSKHSKTNLDIEETLGSLYAMLFFGVPSNGLDAKRLGLAAMAEGQSTEGFLLDIRTDSPMIDKLTQDFLEAFHKRDWVKIFSFHETVESVTAVMVRFLEFLAQDIAKF